jgi:hypothetical protein
MSDFVPIYNRDGQVELWLVGDRLLGLDGSSIGFLRDEHVYDYNGVHRARFIDGIVWDHQGYISGFLADAELPVFKPFLGFRPFVPFKSFEPYRPYRGYPPYRPYYMRAWSELSPTGLFDL